MKQSAYWFISLLGLFFLSCQQSERIIENPVFGVRNSNTLEITKIVLNDTATIFYIDAFYRPKYWIMVDSAAYLQANGKKYQITGSEGIKLSEYHWMPDNGRSSFQLFFPPLPRSVKRVDFIETESERAFNFWDIELYPGAIPTIPELPEALKNLPLSTNATLAEPELKIGKTKLNIHLLHFRKGMDENSVLIYFNELLSGNQRSHESNPDSNQSYHFEFDQYGTLPIDIIYNNTGSSLIVSPGEEIDIWMDLGAVSRSRAKNRNLHSLSPLLYVKGGKYEALNNTLAKSKKYYQIPRSLRDSILQLSTDEYLNKLRWHYSQIIDSLNADQTLSGETREFEKLNHKDIVLRHIFEYGRDCEIAYREVNNIPWNKNIDYKAPEFKPEQLAFLKEYGLNELSMMYSSQFLFYAPRIFLQLFPTEEKLKELLGTDQGLLFDLQKIHGIGQKIENLEPLTEEQQTRLSSIPNKFYAEAFAHMDQQLRAVIEAARQKEGFNICDIPAVSDEKLFDAIMARYKGKVILVDYWATWCGPCRSAMKMTEPLKEKMKDMDIVYVYLTGESSPLSTWLKMIPEIKGEHYRLPAKQWDAVGDKFGIRSIPSYVVVDKQGKPTLRDDFPNVSKMEKVLSEECKK